jgi:hypothetical protein
VTQVVGAGRRDRADRRTLSALSLLSALLPTLLSAQSSAIASGRVVRMTAHDTLPVAGAMVVLHRVGRERQGPMDSVHATAGGEFRFRVPIDTTAIFLISSGWDGIEYFSSPLHTDPEQPDTGLVLMVSDTSSTAPVIVESRHLVISRPDKDGRRAAIEIVVLGNPGPATRVAPDTVRPVWAGSLPRHVLDFQASSGDFSAEALEARDDSVLLFAPIAPGQKQVIYTYALPPGPGRIRLPAFDSIATFNVLLEEFDRTVTGGGVVKSDSLRIEGRSFRQWVGPLRAGAVLQIDFPGAGAAVWVLPLLVGLVAVVLGVVAITALGRPPTGALSVAPPALVDQIARLDARYAGRERQVPADEWARYQADRARLKQEMSAELARRPPPS